MDKFDRLENKFITFKKSLLYSLVIVSIIPLTSGIYGFNGIDQVALISILVGASISTPMLYYFINRKSFKPMTMLNFLLMIFPNALISGLMALPVLYFLNFLGMI